VPRRALEIAIERSSLDAVTRSVAFAILRRAPGDDAAAAAVSLPRLAAACGLARSTIATRIRVLEREGWLTCTKEAGITTIYLLADPSAERTGPVRQADPDPSAERTGPVRQADPDPSGSRTGAAARTYSPQRDDLPRARAREVDDDDFVISEIETEMARLGMMCTRVRAAAIAREVLAGRIVDNRVAYVLAAIRKDPGRWRPASLPPPPPAPARGPDQRLTREQIRAIVAREGG
jgi:hypothetical protein